MNKETWLEKVSKKAFYDFIFYHYYDISESTLQWVSLIGQKWLDLLGDKSFSLRHKKGLNDSFSPVVDRVFSFSDDSSYFLADEYKISRSLLQGIAAVFAMPFFYWQLFISLKVNP